jgi:hypothetical protein
MAQVAAVGVDGLAGFNGGTSLSGASWLSSQTKVSNSSSVEAACLLIPAARTAP